MNSVWLQRDGRSQALIFFAGWGMDAAPFRHLVGADHDILICFDYRDLQLTADLQHGLAGYDSVAVVAWSFGCAAAARLLVANLEAPISDTVAINGTMSPESDDCGIPARLLDATSRNLMSGGWARFVRRMCHDDAARRQFESQAPQRSLQELVDELQALRQLTPPSGCRFKRALIGKNDRIIVPQNQQRGWERYGVPTVSLDAPHYPFHLWNSWEEVLAAGRRMNASNS